MKELLIILVVVLLVFGAKKLKTIGSDLGSAVKGFKKAMNDGDADESLRQIGKEADDAEFPEVAKARANEQKAADRGA